jgi:hypothetical protein
LCVDRIPLFWRIMLPSSSGWSEWDLEVDIHTGQGVQWVVESHLANRKWGGHLREDQRKECECRTTGGGWKEEVWE